MDVMSNVAEDFTFQLGVKLNDSTVDQQLAAIKKKIEGTKAAKISINIDTSDAERKLTSLSNKFIGAKGSKLSFKADISDVDRKLELIRRKINSIGHIKITWTDVGAKGGAKAAVSDMEWAYKQMLDMTKQMNNLQIRITSLGKTSGHNQELDVLHQQLRRVSDDYQTLKYLFDQNNWSTEQWGRMQTELTKTAEKLRQLEAAERDYKASQASKAVTSYENQAAQIQKVTNEYNHLATASKETTEAMTRFTAAKTAMDSAIKGGDVDQIVASYEKFRNALTQINSQLAMEDKLQKQINADARLASDRSQLSSEMNIWLKQNSAAASEFGSRIRELQRELTSCDKVRFDQIKAEFKKIQSEAVVAGKNVQTFGDRLREQLSKLSVYFSAMYVIQTAIRTLRSMYNQVLQVDTAMTGLYRVTNLTSAQYQDLYGKMVTSAKEYGAALNEIIESTAAWVRLGFDANTAERLSEITAMYQHVTDLDNSTAVNNLVTAYKGFQQQLDERFNGDATAAIERVADIYDKLGNEFAESAADVGDGLSKAAAVLAQGGNSIEESAALFTGIQEVLQDSGKGGTTLKILTLRLRGMKGELEDLGEEVDENVESISKMQTHILNITHGKVNIFEDDGSFKSTYEIMEKIHDIWDDLTDTEQADLLETIAGKNRASGVAALIQNWQSVEKSLEAAQKAAGTAAQENEKYMNSLQGKLDTLKAAWQEFSNTALNSDFLKNLIQFGTNALGVITKIVDKLGLLPPILAGISAYYSFKNVGELIKQFYYPMH